MGLIWDMSNMAGSIGVGMKYDPIDDELLVRSQQDVEPTLELNKKLYTKDDEGYGSTRDLRRVASIPNIIVEKWLKEDGINVYREEDWPKVAAKLDDPEYRFLRTAPGKVSRRPVRHMISTG